MSQMRNLLRPATYLSVALTGGRAPRCGQRDIAQSAARVKALLRTCGWIKELSAVNPKLRDGPLCGHCLSELASREGTPQVECADETARPARQKTFELPKPRPQERSFPNEALPVKRRPADISPTISGAKSPLVCAPINERRQRRTAPDLPALPHKPLPSPFCPPPNAVRRVEPASIETCSTAEASHELRASSESQSRPADTCPIDDKAKSPPTCDTGNQRQSRRAAADICALPQKVPQALLTKLMCEPATTPKTERPLKTCSTAPSGNEPDLVKGSARDSRSAGAPESRVAAIRHRANMDLQRLSKKDVFFTQPSATSSNRIRDSRIFESRFHHRIQAYIPIPKNGDVRVWQSEVARRATRMMAGAVPYSKNPNQKGEGLINEHWSSRIAGPTAPIDLLVRLARSSQVTGGDRNGTRRRPQYNPITESTAQQIQSADIAAVARFGRAAESVNASSSVVRNRMPMPLPSVTESDYLSFTADMTRNNLPEPIAPPAVAESLPPLIPGDILGGPVLPLAAQTVRQGARVEATAGVEDLDALAAKIKLILDEQARRHGIDV